VNFRNDRKNQDYSEQELEAMINDVDLDGDGVVTLDDFMYALGSTDGQD